MTTANFRIAQIKIEGFRGFTEPQIIDVNGANLFVFGTNGQGKSSIIEAIRWCLFGSETGTEIEVRNTFYEKQECRVTLKLISSDKQLEIEREIRPGHDYRSRPKILDESGSEVRFGDVLPQLARLGQSESAQVIFSAQHGSGRQVPASISDFGKALCFYLHLEDILELHKELKNLSEEYAVESSELEERVEKIVLGFGDSLREVDARLDELLKSPPWGEGPSPTGAETNSRIREFASEMGRLFGEALPGDINTTDELIKAEQWIDASTSRDVKGFESKRRILIEKLGKAQSLINSLQAASKDIEVKKTLKQETEQTLASALGNDTRESLNNDLVHLEQRHSRQFECRTIYLRAQKAIEEYHLKMCPACGATTNSESADHIHTNEEFDKTIEKLTTLRTRISQIDSLSHRIGECEGEIDRLGIIVRTTTDEIVSLLAISNQPSAIAGLEAILDGMRLDLKNLDGQLANRNEEHQRLKKRVREFERELEYHVYRDQKQSIERELRTGLNDSRVSLREHRDLLQRVNEILSLIESGFREALDRAIPPLNDMLTEVYQRLTQQRSYELVRVSHDPEKVGNLELRVASKALSLRDFPANVLNGQAAKALHLVPYLVFSRFQQEIIELDLLLIDDPSESFDTSHVELLVAELADASKHAQVFVASHEHEKFSPQIKKTFRGGKYIVVNVESFDRSTGPRLKFA